MRSLLLRVSEVLGGEKTISIFFSYPQRHVLNTTRKKKLKSISLLQESQQTTTTTTAMSQSSQCSIEVNDEVRQLVVATYYPPKHTFVVPKGIDLENKEQVADWVIQYGNLYINLIDGKTIRVDSVYGIEEPDFKYPDEQEITDSAEEGIELDDYKDCEFEHFDAELPD